MGGELGELCRPRATVAGLREPCQPQDLVPPGAKAPGCWWQPGSAGALPPGLVVGVSLLSSSQVLPLS